MKRRPSNVFSLAFVDCTFCGFGAVVLLFMIIHHGTLERRAQLDQTLRMQVAQLESAVLEDTRDLVELLHALQETTDERLSVEGTVAHIIPIVQETEFELADLLKETLASEEHLNALKADVKSLEEEVQRLNAGAQAEDELADKIRSFAGEGGRQYLTGLKMGGERIFILVDASASMLDETIVNIIRRRNLPDREKLKSRKWRQAVATVDWLSTHIPPDSKFQIYTFNETARPVVDGTGATWLNAADHQIANQSIENLRRVIPAKGTSLYHAFVAASSMQPPPDNIILLTDGLPTQGEEPSNRKPVSQSRRVRHFREATKQLPAGIPINVVLFPIEGDPKAASVYWKLALATNGSFVNPAEDWP